MKKFKLGAGELLIREQMKNLVGGDGPGTGTIGDSECLVTCKNDLDWSVLDCDQSPDQACGNIGWKICTC